MTQLTTKTAQRLKILQEKVLFLKQGCLLRESLGSQICNSKWNCWECKILITAKEMEIKGIIDEKNELKENLKKQSPMNFIAWVSNKLIQEIEQVENDK